METININNLPDFIEQYNISENENIFKFTDTELLENYQRIKYRYSGRSLNQRFIADIGRMNWSRLQSFVSRNQVTDQTFKRRLVRFIFVMEISGDAPSLTEAIWNHFPSSCFSSASSPTLMRAPPAGTNQRSPAAANEMIDGLNGQINQKVIEINVAKTENELLKSQLLNRDLEANQLKTEIERLKTELCETNLRTSKWMVDKSTQTDELPRSLPKNLPKKIPFNRFV